MQVLEGSSKLPDLVVRSLINTQWSEPNLIEEVKGQDQADDLYANLIGLMCISLLCKDRIDHSFNNGVMGLQIVGKSTVKNSPIVLLINSLLYH
jgi:hypothetical protein